MWENDRNEKIDFHTKNDCHKLRGGHGLSQVLSRAVHLKKFRNP